VINFYETKQSFFSNSDTTVTSKSWRWSIVHIKEPNLSSENIGVQSISIICIYKQSKASAFAKSKLLCTSETQAGLTAIMLKLEFDGLRAVY
jgi:hypothetical protein